MSTILHIDFADAGAGPRDALADFGYTSALAEAFTSEADAGEVPARVVEEQRGGYKLLLQGEDGGPLECDAVAAGALARAAASAVDMPAIGDWVGARPSKDGPCAIARVLPRSSAFIRKAPGDSRRDRVEAQVVAANVDYAFIVAAAGRDWNPRRVERYVALAAAAGTEPVLVIAKADLAEDPAALVAEASLAAPGLRTALVCAPVRQGLGELAFALRPGRTLVLLGSSGAGKSTLLNALAGEALASTGEVREDDQRGRHTTTSRRLFRLKGGALVIDTPGMRELQLLSDDGSVGSAFPEIEAFAAECRFRDCRHQAEPGCAVRSALDSGGLDEGRYQGWLKLTKEAAFLRTKGDHAAKESERRRWRSIEMSRRSLAKAARERGGR